ncbi:MAG TPA: sulfatase [Verrucomicrobiales bacterium]|nr:sulfatase [Verrucomicrobiales bacterium]
MPVPRHVFWLLTACLIPSGWSADSPVPAKPNILFIAVDDLNHWVGHLGRNPQAKTPHLDRLASFGVTFTHAYCAAPACNPSRAALLSGKRPGSTGVYDNRNPYHPAIRPEESLFSHFNQAGYKTIGAGKLWHGGPGWPEQWTLTHARKPIPNAEVDDRSIAGIKFGVLRGGDENLADTHIASFGVEQLSQKHEQPFFLALGFHKPHMPWTVPQKYYDLHPLDAIELPPGRPGDLDDVPPEGLRMANPGGDHRAILESGRWEEAVQAYLAAISYVDFQIGRVLDALHRSPHADNTVICLWGDHGWHLGEKEHWRKFALWEEATRAPLIWVAPGVASPGGVCSRTVDFMSIYPTLCDIAGLPVPEHAEGESVRRLLEDPEAAWDIPAVTTFRRNNHAIRTERWRFIRYAGGGEELYDHTNDPYEWTNLAARDEFADIKADLIRHLPRVNGPETQRENARLNESGRGEASGPEGSDRCNSSRGFD